MGTQLVQPPNKRTNPTLCSPILLKDLTTKPEGAERAGGLTADTQEVRQEGIVPELFPDMVQLALL